MIVPALKTLGLLVLPGELKGVEDDALVAAEKARRKPR